MNYALICTAVLNDFLFLIVQTGNGGIIVGPKDTEAVVGTQLVLHCQTDIKDSANPVEWEFKANYYEQYVTVYKYGSIINGYDGKMKVDANATIGNYDLVIFNVSVDNAGAYTCREGSSQQRAEIIVFEQYPSEKFCLVKPDVIHGTNQSNIEPDQIEISCKLRYHGNLKPHLEWFNGKQLISSNSSTANGTTTSSILLRADKLHSPSFNCRAAYENNMASMFNWTTTVSVTSNTTPHNLSTGNNTLNTEAIAVGLSVGQRVAIIVAIIFAIIFAIIIVIVLIIIRKPRFRCCKENTLEQNPTTKVEEGLLSTRSQLEGAEPMKEQEDNGIGDSIASTENNDNQKESPTCSTSTETEKDELLTTISYVANNSQTASSVSSAQEDSVTNKKPKIVPKPKIETKDSAKAKNNSTNERKENTAKNDDISPAKDLHKTPKKFSLA